jgi:protein SCO1/2
MTEERAAGTDILIRYSVFLIFAAASIIISWFGFDLYDKQFQPAEMRLELKTGTYLSKPKVLLPINLIDQDEKAFTLNNFRNHWTIMAIGYTSCPDICPTLMATFRAIDRILNPEGAQPTANFLFVSVDPERDNPKHVGKYVRYYNPRFLGATGKDQAALKELTSQLGLMYARSADSPTSAMGYLIDHSASIALINPDAAWSAVFTPPHDPQTIGEDIQAVMEHYKKLKSVSSTKSN